MDDLENERQKVAYYHRANHRLQQQRTRVTKEEAENAQREKSGLAPMSGENPTRKMSEPSRLETYLIFNQVNQYAKQLDEHNAMAAARLKLVSSVETTNSEINARYLEEVLVARSKKKEKESLEKFNEENVTSILIALVKSFLCLSLPNLSRWIGGISSSLDVEMK